MREIPATYTQLQVRFKKYSIFINLIGGIASNTFGVLKQRNRMLSGQFFSGVLIKSGANLEGFFSLDPKTTKITKHVKQMLKVPFFGVSKIVKNAFSTKYFKSTFKADCFKSCSHKALEHISSTYFSPFCKKCLC